MKQLLPGDTLERDASGIPALRGEAIDGTFRRVEKVLYGFGHRQFAIYDRCGSGQKNQGLVALSSPFSSRRGPRHNPLEGRSRPRDKATPHEVFCARKPQFKTLMRVHWQNSVKKPLFIPCFV